jgi:hypothetical protein
VSLVSVFTYILARNKTFQRRRLTELHERRDLDHILVGRKLHGIILFKHLGKKRRNTRENTVQEVDLDLTTTLVVRNLQMLWVFSHNAHQVNVRRACGAKSVDKDIVTDGEVRRVHRSQVDHSSYSAGREDGDCLKTPEIRVSEDSKPKRENDLLDVARLFEPLLKTSQADNTRGPVVGRARELDGRQSRQSIPSLAPKAHIIS